MQFYLPTQPCHPSRIGNKVDTFDIDTIRVISLSILPHFLRSVSRLHAQSDVERAQAIHLHRMAMHQIMIHFRHHLIHHTLQRSYTVAGSFRQVLHKEIVVYLRTMCSFRIDLPFPRLVYIGHFLKCVFHIVVWLFSRLVVKPILRICFFEKYFVTLHREFECYLHERYFRNPFRHKDTSFSAKAPNTTYKFFYNLHKSFLYLRKFFFNLYKSYLYSKLSYGLPYKR